LLGRLETAAQAGFRVVEIWMFENVSPKDLAQALQTAGLQLLQFNLHAGDFFAGEMGVMSLPDRVDEFRSNFEQEVGYAEIVGVRQFNGILGNRSPDYTVEEQLACARQNLEWAHPILEAHDLKINIELLGPAVAPNYLLTRSRDLFVFLQELDLPRIGVQYDLFHMQLLEGNLVTTMRENLARVGHIQIADVPDRHQPGTGEINYRYVFGELEKMGYNGFISLEYKPLGSIEESLAWLPVDCRVQGRAADLVL
jgi:hydroxypyruvate isomerase